MDESRLLNTREMDAWEKRKHPLKFSKRQNLCIGQDIKTRAETLKEVLGKMICVRHFNQYLPKGYDMWEMKPSDYLALKRGELPKE